ncbi:hypothetical protein [Halobacterium sp. CBA1126]|uniref:hypothetical protein n=1 Tax=Halobacterium sp. CBA1126 TaxID=2668074 RepID=UPI001E387AB5|nr:hypothetical protein [Halobacterium sp. CBA1126]
MSTYLVGNSWPAVNPFRTLTRPLAWVLGDRDTSLAPGRAAWASTAFLLALVWFEVVSPLADEPRLLAAAAVGYLALSVVGVAAVGHDQWFDDVAPLSRLFAMYGAVAPVQRTDDGLAVRLPAMRLTDDVVATNGGVAFVVAVVWGDDLRRPRRHARVGVVRASRGRRRRPRTGAVPGDATRRLPHVPPALLVGRP